VEEQRLQRRLAAILAADVAGYSRLTGVDEEGTIARLRALRRELIDPTIAAHGGRIVKTTGDGILIEFPSVVEAVRCAVALQRGMAARNTDVTADRRIEFRVGIHLGDVVVDGDDLLGDGVNVAARLEGIAEPGAVCLSGDAYREVRGKIDIAVWDLGEQQLKNIAQPIRVYTVPPASGLPTASPAMHSAHTPRLSIVVLPFVNLNSDKDQDYFVDGITENLTTDLSRIPGAFVIARNTAFTYKGKAVDARQIGRELGVRYVMEGSVQSGGSRLRVNAQLIDAETGTHLWADRFDRERSNLFELQDAITLELAGVLNVRLVEAESRRSERALNPDALDLTMGARAMINRGSSRKNFVAAVQLYQQPLELAPDDCRATIGLGHVLASKVANQWSEAPEEDVCRAEALLARALALDPYDAEGHVAMGLVRRHQHRFDDAVSDLETAIRLNPNLGAAHSQLGWVKFHSGRFKEALPHFSDHMRLSPRDPRLHFGYFGIGIVRFFLGDDDGAIEALRQGIALNHDFSLSHLYLAAAHGLQGRIEEARAALAAYLRTGAPNTSIALVRTRGAMSAHPLYLAQRERLYEGLRKAGLPEE
jgi:TolB-like protein/class 3 adenylate cyclase/Tfp pilus assembly protein PilF